MARALRARARQRPPPLAGLVVALLAGCLNPIESGTLTPGDGVVEGHVYRRCGELPTVVNAQVSVDGVVRAHSDELGFYRIQGVKAGNVHTMAADYAGYVHTETLVSLRQGETKTQDFALETPGDANSQLTLDVLFVIDNTATMAARQEALVEAFPAVAALVEQRTVNLHIGFVTTDLGVPGPYTVPGCASPGDQGLLQLQPVGAGDACARADFDYTTGNLYLAWRRDATGTVSSNFKGTLSDAFACFAPLGTDGCGFPMPLESMARAIDPTNTQNGTFLQDGTAGATLLVVFVTDKDDCSVSESTDTDLFDPFQTDTSSVLGPLSTYRCFEFGVTCDGLPPGRNAGTRSGCVAGAPDPRHTLTPISHYAGDDVLKASHHDRVVVGVLAGPPSPVKVVVDGEGYSRLVPYCYVGGNGAAPAIRLSSFAATRPTPNDVICGDYSTALESWAQQALDLAASSRTCGP